MDTVVVGQLMRGFPTRGGPAVLTPYPMPGDVTLSKTYRGYVRNLVTRQEFSWDRNAVWLVPSTAIQVIVRLFALVEGVFLFALVSVATALFFRVVLSSGGPLSSVVLDAARCVLHFGGITFAGLVMLYPILACLQQASLSHVSLSAVSAAFPWCVFSAVQPLCVSWCTVVLVSRQDGSACGRPSPKSCLRQVVPVFQCLFHGMVPLVWTPGSDTSCKGLLWFARYCTLGSGHDHVPGH
jgi:hypothetical protein